MAGWDRIFNPLFFSGSTCSLSANQHTPPIFNELTTRQPK